MPKRDEKFKSISLSITDYQEIMELAADLEKSLLKQTGIQSEVKAPMMIRVMKDRYKETLHAPQNITR